MDRQPKYKHGDILTNTETGNRTIINKPIFKESVLRKGLRTTGFSKTFTGEYECFWHDDKGETVYGTVSEDQLSKTSNDKK